MRVRTFVLVVAMSFGCATSGQTPPPSNATTAADSPQVPSANARRLLIGEWQRIDDENCEREFTEVTYAYVCRAGASSSGGAGGNYEWVDDNTIEIMGARLVVTFAGDNELALTDAKGKAERFRRKQ
jgi:hypothetical protein